MKIKQAFLLMVTGCFFLTGAGAEAAKKNQFNARATEILISQFKNQTLTLSKLQKLIEKKADINAKFSHGSIKDAPIFLHCLDFSDFRRIQELPNGTVRMRESYDQQFKMLMMLLKAGADINATDGDGNNALCTCIIRNSLFPIHCLRLIKILHEEEKISVNTPNKDGLTPLMIVIVTRPMVAQKMYRNLEGVNPIAKYLVESKADVNAAAPDGTTALMLAAAVENLETVDFLVKNGANIFAKNKKGQQAVDFAKEAEKTDLIKYFDDKELDSL